MQYLIVEDKSNSSLDDIVNELIRTGWVPQGGVAVYLGERGYPVFVQAMIRPTGELGLHDR